MSLSTIYFAMDPIYVKPFKEQLRTGRSKTLNIFTKKSIDISGNLLILQAQFWPKLKKKILGKGMVLIVGRLRWFYSWLEAVSYQPAAFCSTLDSLYNLNQSLKYLRKENNFLSKKIILWLKKNSREKQEYLLSTYLSKPFTSSELDILIMIGKGKTSSEIAALQHRSIHTIKTHRKNIQKKITEVPISILAAKKQIALKTLLQVQKQSEVWEKVLKNTSK